MYIEGVNQVTINFFTLNGRILAQYDDTDNIYFQYNGDTPVGFILNDVQYLYITNLSGDVTGITDENGDMIAQYTYDEWGKLLEIHTEEEDDEEQLSIAEINPLRYRGYYYDNETGYYYLQSRYYDPSICRFINADVPEVAEISNDNKFGINLFLYCSNDPINNNDPTGDFSSKDIARVFSNLFNSMKKFAIIYLNVMAYPLKNTKKQQNIKPQAKYTNMFMKINRKLKICVIVFQL